MSECQEPPSALDGLGSGRLDEREHVRSPCALPTAGCRRRRMKVLVVGSGGREHALCWALAASPLIDKLYCAPGNGGIEREAEGAALDIMDFEQVAAFCRGKG